MSGQLRFGDCLFDAAARQLTRSGEAVHLTPKAFDLLAILIAEAPRAVTKDELRDRLWPDVIVEEANLKNLVGEVRGAVGAKAIRTVHRFGYAFVAGAPPLTNARLIAGDRALRLREGDNVIGRGDDCQVVLDVTGVSRRHAVIRLSSVATLEDLGSKNGTSVNGERVTAPVSLADGDVIGIGAATLTFHAAAAAESTATFR